MQLDTEHKFNFFKKQEKVNNDSNFALVLGFITVAVFSILVLYPNSQKVEQTVSNVLIIPKGAVVAGVLTFQKSFSGNEAPTFVIHPVEERK